MCNTLLGGTLLGGTLLGTQDCDECPFYLLDASNDGAAIALFDSYLRESGSLFVVASSS